MPSWSHGTVSVTGDKNALTNFVKRFIYPLSTNQTMVGAKYFPRTFISDTTREQIRTDIIELFTAQSPDVEERIELLGVEFAHSANHCLITGYPELWVDRCISLPAACAIDGVSVTVETVNFETNTEEIICAEPDGSVITYAEDIPKYVCAHCGSIEPIPSLYTCDPSHYICPQCQQCQWLTLDGDEV